MNGKCITLVFREKNAISYACVSFKNCFRQKGRRLQIRHNHAALFGPEKNSSLQTSVHYITAVIISKVLCDTDSQEEESQNKRLH